MSTKQKLGQFYTTNYKYILQNLSIPKNIKNIIEPFTGNADLLKFIDNIDSYNIECYDIDPKTDKTIKRDTIKNPPDYNNKFVITNPPYLARNKSKDKTKLRTIHHLSAPRDGISVNSGISKQNKSVQYISFKEVVTWVKSLGKKAFIWKSDLTNAYRQLAVAPSAYPLLGIKWLNKYVFDCRGPFGLSSFPAIFQSFGDALLFCVTLHTDDMFENKCLNKKNLHHLLDDFFGGNHSKTVAETQFHHFMQVSESLGVDVSIKKSFHPTQRLTILGYEYDTVSQTVSIPVEKTKEILKLVQTAVQKQKILVADLQSLVGKLRWVCSILTVGAAFVRRLEQLIYPQKPEHFKVRLNSQAKNDLKWWLGILQNQEMLKIPFDFILKNIKQANISIMSDASSHDMGAVMFPHAKTWTSVNCNHNLQNNDILWKELFAVVASVYIWKNEISWQSVLCFCDNQAIVHMLIKRCAPLNRPDLQHLIRIFCYLSNTVPFHFWVEHIQGENNKIADQLSRTGKSIIKSYEMKRENVCVSLKQLIVSKNFVSL